MKTKELINWLKTINTGNNALNDDDVRATKEIIERLEELNERREYHVITPKQRYYPG